MFSAARAAAPRAGRSQRLRSRRRPGVLLGWPEHPETTVTGFAPATVTLPWAQTVPASVPPLSPPAGHLASELAMQMAAGDLRPQTGPRQPRGPQGHASRLLPGETLRCPPTSSPWWETPGVLGSVRPAHRLLPLFAAFGALHAGRGDTEECGSGAGGPSTGAGQLRLSAML